MTCVFAHCILSIGSFLVLFLISGYDKLCPNPVLGFAGFDWEFYIEFKLITGLLPWEVWGGGGYWIPPDIC